MTPEVFISAIVILCVTIIASTLLENRKQNKREGGLEEGEDLSVYRFEIIDHREAAKDRRPLTIRRQEGLQVLPMLQDDGQTLKIFLQDKK